MIITLVGLTLNVATNGFMDAVSILAPPLPLKIPSQMIIALVGLPLNVATNYLLVVVLRWEYVGAAAAMSAAAAYDLVLLLGYVAVTRQWGGVLGAPSRRALKVGRRRVGLGAGPGHLRDDGMPSLVLSVL